MYIFLLILGRFLKCTPTTSLYIGGGMFGLLEICHLWYSFEHRGKGLGGSSAINFFQYHPPSATDIDGASYNKEAMRTRTIY